MENKINIAELLKDCPNGMELDCALYKNVTLECVTVDNIEYPIEINIQSGEDTIELTEYGCWDYSDNAKCIIFPKGKTTWEGFVPPCKFKDGDIVCTHLDNIVILKDRRYYYSTYCGLMYNGDFFLCSTVRPVRLASEEEKEKLLNAIKENGYKWNAEKKCLKPIYPKTYKECCDILGIDTMDNDAQGYKGDLIICFQELIICRDAYWKLYSEEMMLDYPWNPDYRIDSTKFCIRNVNCKFEMTQTVDYNTILAFPSKEMRDAFYENFKQSIELCNELL